MHEVPRWVAAVALAAVILMTAPAEAQAAPCAPGGPPATFSGAVAPADMGTYRVLPFEVAAGTTIELTYDWVDPVPTTPLTATVLDLGLWDEHGHGRRAAALAAASAAAPPDSCPARTPRPDEDD